MIQLVVHLWAAVVILGFASLGSYIFLYFISPQQARLWQLGIWYFLVFLIIFSVAFLAGYFLRVFFWRSRIRYEFLRSSQRQAILLGFLGIISLILQAAQILNLWTSIFLLLIFLLIELYAQ